MYDLREDTRENGTDNAERIEILEKTNLSPNEATLERLFLTRKISSGGGGIGLDGRNYSRDNKHNRKTGFKQQGSNKSDRAFEREERRQGRKSARPLKCDNHVYY